METKSLAEIQLDSADSGMGNYHLNMILSLTDYQPVLKELALILKEVGYFHEASESVLSLILMIDKIAEDYDVVV